MPEQILSSLRKRFKLGPGKAFTLGTLLLIIVFGILFYMYISQNYTYLVERNFRLLATWSKELSETYENSLRSIQFKLDERETGTGDFKSDEIKELVPQGFEDIRHELLYFKDGVPILKDGAQSAPRASEQPSIQSRSIKQQLEGLPYVRIDQVPKESQSFAPPSPLSFRLNLQKKTQDSSGAPANDQEAKSNLTASFALDQFIKTFMTDPVFSDVLLIDPTGLIVYQRNPSSFRFFHLRNFLHNQRTGNGWWDELLKKSGLNSQTFDDQNLTKAIQARVPAHIQAVLGGTEHEIFMQAVVFPEPNGSQSESVSTSTPWILCGLLPTSTFQEQYFAIPFTILLLFIFLLISALLTLPFLSLALMNPRERLGRFSVGTLIITNILGAGVGTFFVLDLSFFQRTTSAFNEQLEAMADSIHEAFQLQLDRLVWQLNSFDQKIAELQDLEHLANAPANAWLARVAIPDPCREPDNEDSRQCFPDYSVAFWIDGEGLLRETWSPGNDLYVRGVHDLRHRDYVSSIQNDRFPLHRRKIDQQWLEFSVQPIINLENSERSFVVSMPHGGIRERAGTDHEWIAAIQTEKLGLLHSAVVPPGSGMAVIDDQTGKVLFHSDTHRMLRENFFEETDNNAELAALIHARGEGGFDGNYWGSGQHFYAKPIEGLPWTLVVFRSKEMLRTINFGILMFSSCLFTLYFLGWLLWLKLLCVIYRSDAYGGRGRWLWPRQRASPVYKRLALIQVGLSILGIIFVVGIDYWQWGADHYALLGLLLPFLGLWLTIRMLWRSAGKEGIHAEHSPAEPSIAWNSPRLLTAFAGLGMTGFILLGVLPAIIFFKLAHDEEMRLFVQQQMWGLAQSLELLSPDRWEQVGTGDTRQNFQYYEREDRPSLIAGCQTEAQMPNPSALAECPLIEVSRMSPDLNYLLQGLYMNFTFPLCLSRPCDSQMRNSDSQAGMPWVHTLHQRVRKSSLHKPMNRESWGFIHPINQRATPRWSTTITHPYQAIGLLLPQVSSHTQRSGMIALHSAAPLFPWNLRSALIGMLIIGGSLFILSYGLLRYVIVRIFPIHLCPYQKNSTTSWEPKVRHESLQNVLILGPPGSGKSAFIHNTQFEWERFDLHILAEKDFWAEASLARVGGTIRAVVVDHFEYQWGIPAQDQEKRAFIEGLLLRNIKVCIVSACNPYERNDRLSPDGALIASPGPQRIWIDLFRTFGLTYFIPDTMETVIHEWLTPQSGDGPAEEREQLFPANRLLQHETANMMHLEKIGKWIRSFPEWSKWSPEKMKEQFQVAATPYYWALWESISQHEKLALYHVASDGYLHANNAELATLNQKGLLRVNPDLQLLNTSFQNFVLEMATHSRLAEWEASTNADTWAHLKYPFLLIFVVVVVFLFGTQQEFKHSFISFISLLPILLPALPELPMLFAQKQSGSSSA